MTIIVNINGQDIPVDDAFGKLTPEQQDLEKAHIAQQMEGGASFGGGQPAAEPKEPRTVGGLPVQLAPQAGAAIGATAGAILSPSAAAAVDKPIAQIANRIKPTPVNPNPNAPQSVRNWLATQTSTPYAGGRDYEEAKVKADIAGSKPIQSRGSAQGIRRGNLGINVQPPAVSLPQKAAANILNAERMPKPGIARRIGGMGVAGAEFGNMLSEYDQGNYGRAALSGLGSAGGAMSQSGIKPVRAIGTALSLGVPAIQKFLLKDEDESNIQEKAAGGSVTSPKLKSLSDFLDQLMQQSNASAQGPAPAAPQGQPQQGGIPLSPEQQAASLAQGQQAPGMNAQPQAPMGNLPGAQPPSPMPQMAGGGLVQHFAGGKLATAGKVAKKLSGGLDLGNILPSAAFRAAPEQTVTNPIRNAFPGIYQRPDVIAQQAAARVAPEDPMLKRLFGVTRDDLYEMSQRQGNVPGLIPGASKNPKGSAAAEAVMNPRNTQRLVDVLSEVKTNAPDLYRGMHAWYTMDPQYHRMVELMGEEKAKQMYHRLNTFGGIESPNLPVPVEFNRATAANWLAEQGRIPDWIKYGGLRDKHLVEGMPSDIIGVPGRVGHQRASESQRKFMDTGFHGMDSPKAPPYIQASSVPELGFQTDLPVGDAHWSRMIGLPDVRTSKEVSASVSTPELQQLAPWWKNDVAGAVDLESVPAQAIMWGAGSPQTGVKTAIGAGKLELQAIQMAEAAKRLGISPEDARDMILMGEGRAGKKEGGLV